MCAAGTAPVCADRFVYFNVLCEQRGVGTQNKTKNKEENSHCSNFVSFWGEKKGRKGVDALKQTFSLLLFTFQNS